MDFVRVERCSIQTAFGTMRRGLSGRFGLIKERLTLIVVAQQRGEPALVCNSRMITAGLLAPAWRIRSKAVGTMRSTGGNSSRISPRRVGHASSGIGSASIIRNASPNQSMQIRPVIRVVDRRAERKNSDLRELRR
jgi:hypothetical protein